jgi:hypothetical protein
MQTLSYTFPDAITPSYLPLYLLLAFFLFGFGLMKSRYGHILTLGTLNLILSLIFFSLVSLWFFYHQGGTHRFYALEAKSDAIRLFFSKPDETISIARFDIASLIFGLDSPIRSNKTWCYLRLTTHSGQRHVSHNVLGTDCKVYRQQIIQLLGL